MTEEIWKWIPGYEGRYQVSTKGRVRSFLRCPEGSLMKPYVDHGYKSVRLYKNRKQRKYYVHQVMAMAFLGHTPNGYSLVVDHIDNDKMNNIVSNLQLVTPRVNTTKDAKGFSSKYVGVAWVKADDKWRASITLNGKQKFLGYYKTELGAHLAYINEREKIDKL